MHSLEQGSFIRHNILYRIKELEDYFTEKKTYTITTQPDTKTYNEIVNFLT